MLEFTVDLYRNSCRFGLKDQPDAGLSLGTLAALTSPGAAAVPLLVQQLDPRAEGLSASGAAEGFEARAQFKPVQGDHCQYVDAQLQVAYSGPIPVERGLRLPFTLIGPGRPTWLIPGAFYKENRLPQNQRKYPRWDYEGGDPQELVSSRWAFRSDRAALPAVFAWNDQVCAALCTDEVSPVGITGVGFAGDREGTALWLDFPYREEPVLFIQPGKAHPPDIQYHRWQPGETVTLHYRIYLAQGEPHAYDPFIRQMYAIDRTEHGLNPWVGLREAADLTAHGLFRWHYEPGAAILMETAAFDREFNGNVKGQGDRPNMHVGWVSGVPYAHALLQYARQRADDQKAAAALAVMNKIASGIAPCGSFWGEWRGDRGWSCGWTPHKTWIQARTIAEATLFMIRALAMERDRSISHPDWEAAVRSNLAFIASRQRPDGNFGSYWHFETGEITEWDGAGGLLWIAALTEGSAYFDEPVWAAAAQRAGEYYSRFVRDEFIYGAPEDVHLTPTSEDGYNAVIAYVALYEADQNKEWLDLATIAADWTMTFRWTYNLAFPARTILAHYDFRTRGADQASPSNQHLHNYGLICLPEMVRLWRYTGDDYYLERTRDNLACFLQFIAREDGDFNAYKGMVTERYYNTNCFQPKGMLLTLSHAWSVGVTLYAALASAAYEKEWGVRLALPADGL